MSLYLEFTIVLTRQVVECMRCRENHEGDAIFELVADLNNLMLVHVLVVCWIIVTRKQLDEADGIGKSVHSAFGVVKVDAGNPLAIISFRSLRTRRATAFWLLLSNRTSLPGLKFSKLA